MRIAPNSQPAHLRRPYAYIRPSAEERLVHVRAVRAQEMADGPFLVGACVCRFGAVKRRYVPKVPVKVYRRGDKGVNRGWVLAQRRRIHSVDLV